MTHPIRMVEVNRILDAIEGAVIVSGYIEDDEGMHLVFADGRCLVIAGMFALSLLRLDRERLH